MKLEPLEKDFYYHIYNRGINGCKIFKNDDNYNYFIKLFSKYLHPYITVYAYCLLSNHFHFVIKIETEQRIVSQKLSNFFNAYAKAFNKATDRTGSLFEKPFKRIRVQSEDYLKNLIIYAHTNPVKHKILNNFKDYHYSSYSEIVKNNSDLIDSKKIIELFDNYENFKFVHKYKNIQLSYKYTLEL